MNEKMLAALTSSIYVSRLTLSGGAVDTDDKRLRASGLYPDWAPGDHPQGEIFNAGGQTWEVFQAYDNAVYPDIRPGEAAWYTFNRPLHGTSPETARPFVPVQGAHDMYRVGEYMIWTDGNVYRCVRDTNYSPEEYAADWKQTSGLDDGVNPDDVSAAEAQSADQPAAAPYSLRSIASAVGRLFRAE